MSNSEIDEQDLVRRAIEARDRAYAPYSGYRVGCVVEVDEQTVYDGANVENASYGLATCAERNAIIRAVLDGHRKIRRIVVATDSSPPATPCGLCLQTMNEFAAPDLSVILVNADGQRRTFNLSELLPHGFKAEQLKTGS